jgi:hypothetical protein
MRLYYPPHGKVYIVLVSPSDKIPFMEIFIKKQIFYLGYKRKLSYINTSKKDIAMKQKILLLLFASAFIAGANAQKKSKPITAYAITAAEKGNSRWTEVKLVDVSTGEEIQSIYKSADELTPLNARTGKPVVKKEMAKDVSFSGHKIITCQRPGADGKQAKIEVNGDVIIIDGEKIVDGKLVPTKRSLTSERVPVNLDGRNVQVRVVTTFSRTVSDAPFATSSAACAYDKKHERLYYTPMGINQLRYIDLKSKTPQVFYFEDEQFGPLNNPGDVPNQITRMTIGGDGDGYALTNNGEHLIRFTTNKKAVVTDLGSLADDASNGNYSIHSHNGYGGDMVADKSGNLYLVTANRAVFKINIENRTATFKGTIKGLPRGFTTNGAVVEKGTNIIVTSSTATTGYYMFDVNTMQAKKVSSSDNVYNASDLANGNLLSDKNKKDKKAEEQPQEEPQPQETAEEAKQPLNNEIVNVKEKLTVYPNPVTNGVVNLSFADYAPGRYEIQVFDLNGKILQTRGININAKSQLQEIKLSSLMAKGNYLIKVVGESGKLFNVEKLIVQ